MSTSPLNSPQLPLLLTMAGDTKVATRTFDFVTPQALSCVVPSVNFGFYSDGAAARTLLVGMGYTAPLTPEKCLDACHAQGYQYAGLEYSAVRLRLYFWYLY